MPAVVGTTIEKLELIKTNKSMNNVDIMAEMQEIMGEVVGRIFFGDKFGNYRLHDKPITVFISETTEALGSVLYDPMY